MIPVEVEKNDLGIVRVFSNSSKVPVGPNNTAYRAAEGIIEKYELKNGVDIHIQKRIPIAQALRVEVPMRRLLLKP